MVCGEPGEEPGPVGLFSAAAEAVQHPPRCVGVYESTVAVPVDAAQDGGEEAFGGGQRLVTCGEDAVGDQHLAQVGGARRAGGRREPRGWSLGPSSVILGERQVCGLG